MSNNTTSEKAEFYHDNGMMPNWAYYQLNGKSAQENYADQKNKRNEVWRNELLGKSSEADFSNVHITSEVRIKK